MTETIASTQQIAESFRHDISVVDAVMRRVRQRLGQYLLSRGLQLFMRNGDSISLDPLVNGDWDLLVVLLLRHAATRGYDGFLLDIGANIGLTSSQCGDAFEQVLMFEPNPEIVAILDLNTKMSLQRARRRLFDFGLGPVSKRTTLMVPPGNWGAAFVHDDHNAYTDELLSREHHTEKVAIEQYRPVPIRIESVAEALPPLFAELASAGATKGAIKIDVEGYEVSILKEIAAIVPREFELFIVFESWDSALDVPELLGAFGRRAQAYSAVRYPNPRGSLKRDLPAMVRRGGTTFRLIPAGEGATTEREMVLIIGAA